MSDAPPPKRTEKLQLMLDALELEAIDAWRFDNRMPSRAAAIRELIRRGLLSKDATDAPAAQASSDYRIVDPKAEE